MKPTHLNIRIISLGERLGQLHRWLHRVGADYKEVLQLEGLGFQTEPKGETVDLECPFKLQSTPCKPLSAGVLGKIAREVNDPEDGGFDEWLSLYEKDPVIAHAMMQIEVMESAIRDRVGSIYHDTIEAQEAASDLSNF